MFVTYFSGPRVIFTPLLVSCFSLSQYLILCFKNNTASVSSTSKTSTDMVYEPNTASIYKRVHGQKQQAAETSG